MNIKPDQLEDTIVKESQVKPKLPKNYKVILLNDDYTPMEFVVIVLNKFFAMTSEEATQVMMKVHREGVGVCGVFVKDVATTKVDLVSDFSRQYQHPLQCTMEEA